eukprot:Skav230085  [mRNA]  locus=scaffold2569:331557:334545:- [translate_table: standard]
MTLSDQRLIDKDGNLVETQLGRCWIDQVRLAILTEMSQNQTLDFGNKFQSDFYTSDEMSKFKKRFACTATIMGCS